MVKGRRRNLITMFSLIIFSLVIFSGCSGKKPVAITHSKVTDPQREETVTAFSHKIRPLIEDTDRAYVSLTQAVVQYGYSEIDQNALAQRVNQALNATQKALQQVEAIEAEDELEEVKGGLSTCLNLRNQEIQKLQKLVQGQKPKTSELNKILENLRPTEGFLDRGKNKLEELESQVGISTQKNS